MYSFINVSEPKKRRSHSCCLWMTSTPTGLLWQTTWATQAHVISRWYQKQVREAGTNKKDKRYDSHLLQRSFITLHCCIFQVTATFDFYTWPPPNWVQLQTWFREFILHMTSHCMAWSGITSQSRHMASAYDTIYLSIKCTSYGMEAVIVPGLV